jgi:hypothetical protein
MLIRTVCMSLTPYLYLLGHHAFVVGLSKSLLRAGNKMGFSLEVALQSMQSVLT